MPTTPHISLAALAHHARERLRPRATQLGKWHVELIGHARAAFLGSAGRPDSSKADAQPVATYRAQSPRGNALCRGEAGERAPVRLVHGHDRPARAFAEE